jgi:3-hydroxyisobutyrate dehydrogenase-like beta-hydroxyacid dehydrogenase
MAKPAANKPTVGGGSGDRVGVVGLGIIGSVWAQKYDEAGLLAGAWSRTPRGDAPRQLEDAASVARESSIVHIVVTDPPAVTAVLESMLPELRPRHLVIQSTTIDPDSSERFARNVAARGAHYLEAPFMGSRPAAEQGKTVFLLGGGVDAIERADAVLGHLSQLRHRVGTERQAATLKLCLNLQVAIMMEGICESLHAARQAEIPEATFFDVLRSTALWSGFQALKEPKLREGDFSPQFSVKHMLKDVRLATTMTFATKLPLGTAVQARLEDLVAKGLEGQDIAALIATL